MVDNSDAQSGVTGITVQSFATDAERSQAYEEWRRGQHQFDAGQREADAEHQENRDEFLALEAEVDEKVDDSIRWAETTIQET